MSYWEIRRIQLVLSETHKTDNMLRGLVKEIPTQAKSLWPVFPLGPKGVRIIPQPVGFNPPMRVLMSVI